MIFKGKIVHMCPRCNRKWICTVVPSFSSTHWCAGKRLEEGLENLCVCHECLSYTISPQSKDDCHSEYLKVRKSNFIGGRQICQN